MPWKQNYTVSDEVGIADDEIKWPADKRCGFNVVVDLNPAVAPEGVTKESLCDPTWHYGMREGLPRFLEMFARLGLRVTFAVPAVIADIYPDLIRHIATLGHEIAINGFLGEDPNLVDAQVEADRIRRATDVIGGLTGARPEGWYGLPRPGDAFATGAVSQRTISLLIDNGYAYFGNGLADDAPHYWVVGFDTRKSLLSLPYYYHFDDRFFLMFPAEGTGLERPETLLRNWRSEFAAQYRRGRYFSLTVSPARSGWGHRFDNLTGFLTDAASMPGLWMATGAEVAAHWNGVHPAAAYLKLERSIWRDYEGSLS